DSRAAGGAAPPTARARALLRETGRGNTKGGFYEKRGGSSQPPRMSLPLGSVTFATKVKDEAKASNIEFAEAAAKLRDSLLAKPLSEQVAAHPGLVKADPVYLSGGIVWSMASVMHPHEPQEEYVAIAAH